MMPQRISLAHMARTIRRSGAALTSTVTRTLQFQGENSNHAVTAAMTCLIGDAWLAI